MLNNSKLLSVILIILVLGVPHSPVLSQVKNLSLVDNLIGEHPDQTGVYILEKGEEALYARAWLADHAQQSIEVQYFIWSTDNIGILASEALPPTIYSESVAIWPNFPVR